MAQPESGFHYTPVSTGGFNRFALSPVNPSAMNFGVNPAPVNPVAAASQVTAGPFTGNPNLQANGGVATNAASIGGYTPVTANQLAQLGVNTYQAQQADAMSGSVKDPTGGIDKTPKMTGLDYFNTAKDVVGMGMQGYFGLQNLNMAKEQFAFQKDAYTTNMAQNKASMNRQLEDRQRYRNAEGNHNAMDVNKYMQQYGVK